MKKNKKRFIALILCLILSFNIVSAFEVPEAEAIAGVDDVAFMCLLAGVVASTGYIVSNQSGLSSLGSSLDRYIDDNYSADSDVVKQRKAVGATGIGASIALSSVPALVSVIKEFSNSFRSSSVAINRPVNADDLSKYKTLSLASILSSCGIHKKDFDKPDNIPLYCAYFLIRSSDSSHPYILYALTVSDYMKEKGAVIRKYNNSYSWPCYGYKYYVQRDEYFGGLMITGIDGNAPQTISCDRVVSFSCGSLSLWDVDSENQAMRAYYPTGSASFVGDGKARTLAPEMPVTTNNITNIYENSIADGASDTEALERAIQALDHNSQVANAEMSSILNQYLSQILTKLDSITVALSKPATEGSSALQLEGDQWKVVEGSGGNPKNDDDNNNKRPKWATLAFLAPLVMVAEDLLDSSGISNDILEGIKSGVNTGFENIGNAIDSIKGFVSSILEAIKALPEAIFNAFKDFLNEWKAGIEFYYQAVVDIIQAMKVGIETLVNYVFDILTQLQALPQALADILADQFAKIEINPIIQPIVQPELNPNIEVNPAIEVNPNIELSPLLNPLAEIVRLLEEILEAIKEFFSINTEAISDNWNSKTPNFSINKYAKPFIFAHEFGNEPPILVVDTPDVVRGFYDHDQIVIFDARNYDKYFKIIRMIVNAIIIIAYAYACLCKFKVRFSM